MEPPQQTVLLGSPKEVSLAELEHELTQLWKEAESNHGDSFHPVVRSCTMNLIVVTEDESGADAVAVMVGEVTLEHPARIFLVVLDRKAKESSLNAWISARCAIPEPGQEQVCCEQITLVARGQDTAKITSAVTSLLVPDVSTMLLWKTSIDAEDPIVRSLLAITDRALIDSSEESEPLPAFLEWRLLANAGIWEVTLGDLAWTHVTAWRAVIARAFESDAAKSLSHDLDEVTVEYSTSQVPRHSGFSQSFLLMGWLAHAFRWDAVGGPCDMKDGSVDCTLLKGKKRIRVQLKPVTAAHGEPGGIERIVLSAGKDLAVEFKEGQPRNEIVMTMTANGQSRQSVVPLRTLSESELMARELEILLRDEVYEESLDMLCLIVKGTKGS